MRSLLRGLSHAGSTPAWGSWVRHPVSEEFDKSGTKGKGRNAMNPVCDRWKPIARVRGMSSGRRRTVGGRELLLHSPVICSGPEAART